MRPNLSYWCRPRGGQQVVVMVTHLPEEWGGHDVGSLLSSLWDPRYKCSSDTKLQATVAIPQLHCVPVNLSAV